MKRPFLQSAFAGTASLTRTNPLVVLSLVYLVVLVVFSLFPQYIAPESATASSILSARQPPSWQHLFGTDAIGRDVFSRVVYGTRLSVAVGILSVSLGLVLGGVLGMLSGYRRGLIDGVIMRLMDVMLAFPGVLLAMAIIAARGRSLENLILAIGLAAVPDYARFIRGQVLSLRGLPYVEASIASGGGTWWILGRHLLPNLARPLLAFATIGAGFALLAGSSLSFIGLGAQPPTPEWGAMLSDGRSDIEGSWWIGAFPGLAIFLTVVSINIVSQWLREQSRRFAS
jgi:peptide/nickel transport system permease protein